MKNTLLVFICFFLGSCSSQNPTQYKSAGAILEPVDGSNVRGSVLFTEENGGIKITAWFTGLTPGEHGLAIHEHGDCGGKGAANAGLNFNPDHSPHAGPFDSPGMVGDLGNVYADWRGRASLERRDFVIAFEGQNSIIGKSVVVHRYRDDYRSQPSGNVGPGVACGVILPID
jgi:superoxide dismutase, Cu-Zn family